jgi:hypothetical protein
MRQEGSNGIKAPRRYEAAKSEEGKNIRQDLRENHPAKHRETNSRIFCQDTIEGSAPSRTKEEITNSRLRAINV